MPKLKVIPNPVQARILRALIKNIGLRILWNGNSAGAWAGHRAHETARELGQPKSSTIRKMIAETWLVNSEDARIYYSASVAGRLAVEDMGPIILLPSPKTIKAYDVIKALRKRHPHPSWATMTEVSIAHYGGRRVDYLALRVHTTSGSQLARDLEVGGKYLDLWIYEIKVDRGDFLKEIADHRKRERAMAISTHFAFATPAGLVEVNEVPVGCGLIEVDASGRPLVAKRTPRSIGEVPTWRLVAAMLRSMMRNVGEKQ